MLTDKQINQILNTRAKLAIKGRYSGVSTRDCLAGRCLHYGCVRVQFERVEREIEEFNLVEPAIGLGH